MTDQIVGRFVLGGFRDGIRIDALERADLLRLLEDSTQSKKNLIIAHHNLHSLYLHETDAAFRSFYKMASWIYIDGLPIVWLGQLAGLPLRASHRITFLDSFEALVSDLAERNWRVFYLGSQPRVLANGVELLRERHPRLEISGCDGYYEERGMTDEEVITQINEFETDILFVGMGMPRQEQWIAEHQAALRVSAILTSGATMDYVAGDAYKPPAWAGSLGLYGLCRLLADPGRLWKRYLLEPLIIAGYLSGRIIRGRFGMLGDTSRS